ncbi:MAG: DsbA family oxidoreductase [Gemmatimonadetes bacterium]|nr:DsbA family oxidoreductase [Gemmatimonadota bacterium]
MLVEIWSDVACPFCWLGKRRFETALARFERPDMVDVAWKSFQLNPALRTDPSITIHDHLARTKGIAPLAARGMNERLSEAGRGEGVAYDFDRIVVANTFDAHRLIQLAKTEGKADEAEERLFRAYFGEGSSVADRSVLVELAGDIGLERARVAPALEGDDYADEVRADIAEARELGINGVPFFVIDGRYAVSGAQDAEVFANALEQVLAERAQTQSRALS